MFPIYVLPVHGSIKRDKWPVTTFPADPPPAAMLSRRAGSASRHVAARGGLIWDPGLPRPDAAKIVTHAGLGCCRTLKEGRPGPTASRRPRGRRRWSAGML